MLLLLTIHFRGIGREDFDYQIRGADYSALVELLLVTNHDEIRLHYRGGGQAIFIPFRQTDIAGGDKHTAWAMLPEIIVKLHMKLADDHLMIKTRSRGHIIKHPIDQFTTLIFRPGKQVGIAIRFFQFAHWFTHDNAPDYIILLFYLLDGGFTITSRYKPVIAGKNILATVGGSRKEKGAPPQHTTAECGDTGGQRQHRNFYLRKMPGVEHAFPDEYMGTLLTWVRKMVQKGLP